MELKSNNDYWYMENHIVINSKNVLFFKKLHEPEDNEPYRIRFTFDSTWAQWLFVTEDERDIVHELLLKLNAINLNDNIIKNG